MSSMGGDSWQIPRIYVDFSNLTRLVAQKYYDKIHTNTTHMHTQNNKRGEQSAYEEEC